MGVKSKLEHMDGFDALDIVLPSNYFNDIINFLKNRKWVSGRGLNERIAYGSKAT